jgi:hypothetical protein
MRELHNKSLGGGFTINWSLATMNSLKMFINVIAPLLIVVAVLYSISLWLL